MNIVDSLILASILFILIISLGLFKSEESLTELLSHAEVNDITTIKTKRIIELSLIDIIVKIINPYDLIYLLIQTLVNISSRRKF